MSEVIRYLASYFPYEGLDLNGQCARHDGEEFVHASDFDRVTAERDAALADLKRHQSLFNQSEKALDRVHCMYMKRLLDLTGEPQVALVPDEEFVKYFEELKTLKRENSGLQQRLTAADERSDVLEGLLRRVHKSTALTKAGDLWQRIDAALKPAGGGGDE